MKYPSRYDVAIIGGGIVGLATAMALVSRLGLDLIVLEAEDRLAVHQTGNNSGIIHSGLYYRPGSLKANNCKVGREALYRFCIEHGIPHERCGKVVVASSKSQLKTLNILERNGLANGLEGLKRITPKEIREHEPHVSGIAGLWVPETGIVDFVQVTEKFAQIIRDAGSEISTNSHVVSVRRESQGLVLKTATEEVFARNIINCGGLQSDRIARMCGLKPGIRIIPFRGEYYELDPSKCHLIRNLIYPVSDLQFPFLGVHFTRTIKGRVDIGPNAILAFKREGYERFNFSPRDAFETFTFPGIFRLSLKHWKIGLSEHIRSFSKRIFVKTIQKLLPEIKMNDLRLGGAGVRAQALDQNGSLVDDFRIVEANRMIHVLNAPSPAATASISIGQSIAKMAERKFLLK